MLKHRIQGASLWLIPPKGLVYDTIETLISTTFPKHFETKFPTAQASSGTHDPDGHLKTATPPMFYPHLTLTSFIDLSKLDSDPQAWLNSLQLPDGNNVNVQFEEVVAGKKFFQKLYVLVEKQPLLELGSFSRWQAVEAPKMATDSSSARSEAERWAKEEWMPHVSLLYGDVDITEAERLEAEGMVGDAGIWCTRATQKDGKTGLAGWTGGRIWLVPTEKPIHEWKPIAEKQL
jgi:2',3'-cyclic-nucleotide 3'-phosphodiesterase